MKKQINVICLVLESIAAFLLFGSPYIKVYITDVSAFKLLTYTNLTSSHFYWSALSCCICIVICAICTATRNDYISKVIAGLALIPLGISAIGLFSIIDGNIRYFFEVAGPGYWGTALIFIFLVLKSNPASEENDQQQTTPTHNGKNEYY